MSLLNPFYNAIAWLIVHIHDGMAPIFGAGSGASWALSIVLLTIAMRLLLFPLFVKQIKSQRAMTALQPQMKELQAKYKNDKERLNQEMMALWKENGTNPFAGCLPIIVQIPVFFALFKVLNSLHPNKQGLYTSHFDGILTQHLTQQASLAKVFGVPIGASFSSSTHTLNLLNASATSVKVFSAILIVLMGASTFITQRQLMARNKKTGAASMPANQQTLLYVLPLVFAVFGLRFPLGVLLYWLTTNVWSMAQQAVVIRRMDAAPAAVAAPRGPSGPAPGAKPAPGSKPVSGAKPTTGAKPAPASPRPAAPGSDQPRAEDNAAAEGGSTAGPTGMNSDKRGAPRQGPQAGQRPAGRNRRNRRGRR